MAKIPMDIDPIEAKEAILGYCLKKGALVAGVADLEALERIGPASLNLLMQTARDHPRIDARRLAIRSLGRVGGPAVQDSDGTWRRRFQRGTNASINFGTHVAHIEWGQGDDAVQN